jgi:subtilisin family serine protease
MRKFTSIVCLALSATVAMANINPTVTKGSGGYFRMPDNIQADEYMAKTVIVQVKDQYRANCMVNGIENLMMLNSYFVELGANQVNKIFPNHTPPEKKYNELGQKYADLSLIYTIKYTSDANLEKVINKLFSLGYFEYAQPYYIPKADFTPNDPQQGSQYHLTRIDAYTGWDVQQGNSNVVIGITDTGVDLTHVDLTNQIKYNTADPINGSDDDNDGFTDNYRGWDVAMNDNDPTWQSNNHGVHVSGCAAAQTNNSTGVASPGFNCKILPVKISNASGALVAAYQGITYAADHGCQIINCSWGGTGGGPFGQTIIDYATINRNSLVVAAAGNNGVEQDFWPAAYNYVLSVGATQSNDTKVSFSNYGYSVDIMSPGNNILATLPGNQYGTMSGTSMASPVCAGVVGIIKAQFPSYTALQLLAYTKATAKSSILSLSGNLPYAGKLGTGLVNMNNAMTMSNVKYVSYENVNFTDNNDNSFVGNDTINIAGNFINYLTATSSSCTATITTTSTAVTLLGSTTFTVGALNTLGQTNNNAAPFRARVNVNAPLNAAVQFRVRIIDGIYQADYYFNTTVNVDYINVTVNDVKTTITSKGRIGYNLDGQQQGLGFVYMDSSMMYESSFMLGSSATMVSDMFRESTTGNNDNSTVTRVYKVTPNVFSDFDLDGTFRDNLAPSPVGITTHHKAYAWTSTGNRKFVIVEYVMRNTGSGTVSNLFGGVISDWDVMNYVNNKANEDQTLKMGYVYNTANNGLYAGIKLLTSGPFVHYAVDNITGGGGGIDPTAGTPEFSTSEKYTTLSTNRPTAGGTGTGNDVMDVVSTGPFTLNVGDSVKIAFALIAGDNLSDLQTGAGNAQIIYNGLTGVDNLVGDNSFMLNSYPNPASGTTMIQFNLSTSAMVDLKLFDVTGREVVTIDNGQLAAGMYQYVLDVNNMSNGIYFYSLNVNGKIVTKKLIVNNN